MRASPSSSTGAGARSSLSRDMTTPPYSAFNIPPHSLYLVRSRMVRNVEQPQPLCSGPGVVRPIRHFHRAYLRHVEQIGLNGVDVDARLDEVQHHHGFDLFDGQML